LKKVERPSHLTNFQELQSIKLLTPHNKVNDASNKEEKSCEVLTYSQTAGGPERAQNPHIHRGVSTAEKDERINMVNLAFEKRIYNMREKYELKLDEMEHKLELTELQHSQEKEHLNHNHNQRLWE